MIEIFILKNKKLEKVEINNLLNKKINWDKIWIDINDIKKEEGELLDEIFEIHNLIIEDMLNPNTRIKIEEFKEYLFMVFYGIDKNNSLNFIELDFILNDKLLITNQKRDIDVYENLKEDKLKLEKIFIKGTDFLFHYLIDKKVDEFYPSIEKISESIEKIESEIINQKPSKTLISRILKLKREINYFRRISIAQREKLSFLAKRDFPFISKKAVPYFRDVYDHITNANDLVEDSRDAISNTYEIYTTTLSNNMNEVMKILSVFASISLPLSVISGIYGTNFANLPGAGFYFGFWTMIFIMGFVSVVMLILFKKKGWF